jgi:hypothetical protein
VSIRAPARARTTVNGGTQRERRLLRSILRAPGTDAIERIRIQSGGRIVLVARRTDRASSTRGKWLALLVGSAFANSAERRNRPNAESITVITPGLPVAEGRRLAVRFPGAPRPPVLARLSPALVARQQPQGLVLRRVVAFRVSGKQPDAVEVTGTLRAPSDYLRVLSTIAAAPPVGRGAYYELSDAHEKVLMRFGMVNDLAPGDRLVAWVSPALLERW